MLAFFALFAAPLGADEEIPLRNWTAPPYWSQPAVSPGTNDQNGRTALAAGRQALATSPIPLPFVAVPPCRVIDTRGNGFISFWGPPSLLGFQAERTFPIVAQCGIPADAKAVSFNFSAVNPAALGDFRVFPAGGGTPLVATLSWPAGVFAISNAAVVPLGPTGIGTAGITLHVDSPGSLDLVVGINGYYSPLGVVNSLNGQAGDLTLVAGTNVTITPGTGTLSIAAAGGGGGAGTVTSVGTGAGLTGGPITSTGTVSVAPLGITTGMLANNAVTSAKRSVRTVSA